MKLKRKITKTPKIPPIPLMPTKNYPLPSQGFCKGFYYWRVQSKNAGGKVWSEVLSFNTNKIVSNEGEDIPEEYALSQNYPNPFNPVTQIRYALPEAVYVRLEVRNILGQRVRVLVNERKKAGYHVVSLNGNTLASGVYFYTIEAGDFRQTNKMLLIK